MFEDRTYKNIMAECLDTAPPGIDLRQGGIFYDAVASACFKIAQFYADISTVFELVFLTTAAQEYLDRKGEEYGVFRNPATSARYEYLWTGAAEPSLGERFFADGIFFVLRRENKEDSYILYLEGEQPGSASNNIIAGTPAIPMNNIGGLTSSAFGNLIEPGADIESDDNYRRRIQEKIAGPAENGNRQHYKTWCESDEGVGRARIIPLFAGPNTVMGVIIGTDGLPAAQAIVDRVQEYIDPMTRGITVEYEGHPFPVGDGLGDGVANIGAHFAAVAPDRVPVNVVFSAELKTGATIEQIKADTIDSLTAYLRGLALDTPEREPVIVRISTIGSLLHSLPGLLDHAGLTLGGRAANIELAPREVAVLGEVTVNEIV